MARRRAARCCRRCPRQVAHEAAGEAIARASGIVRLFERERRDGEDAVLVDEHRAVFATFHDQCARPHLEDVPGGAEKIVLAGKLARFGIVDHEDIDVFQGFAQLGVGALDPVVHGVHAASFGFAFNLMQHVALQVGGDVGEENIFGIAILLRQARLELGEDVQIGGQGDALVQIFGVAAGPEEAFTGGALETFDVDVALRSRASSLA